MALRYEVDDAGIATLTLDRPDKRNAVMPEDWRDLERYLEDGTDNSNVRAFVLTGAGDVFCAGGDLKTMPERFALSTPARSRQLLRMVRAVERMRQTPKPLIAAINGAAIGAGWVIALACDLRVCATSATFAAPYLRVGLTPDFGGAYFLPRFLGPARALELLWTGESLNSADAERLGLVNRVFADNQFAALTRAYVAKIARNAPGGLALSKLTVYRGCEQSLGELLDLEALALTVIGKSEDAAEGVRAFLKKRAPEFQGD